MAREVQTPSGTSFDPGPQFWIGRAAWHGPGSLTVADRCFPGPVCAGLVFDGAASMRDGGWPASTLVPCCLRVTEIRVYARLAEEISQGLSALLILGGEASAGVTRGAVLVARSCPPDGWSFQDGLWAR